MCDCGKHSCTRYKCVYSLTTIVLFALSLVAAFLPWVALKGEQTRSATNALYVVADKYDKDNPEEITFNKFNVVANYLAGLRVDPVAAEITAELAAPDSGDDDGPRLQSSEEEAAPDLLSELEYAFGPWTYHYRMGMGPFQPGVLSPRQTGTLYKALNIYRQVDPNNDFPLEQSSFWVARVFWAVSTIKYLLSFAFMFIAHLKRYYGISLITTAVCQIIYLAVFGAVWTSAQLELKSDFSPGATAETAEYLNHFEFVCGYWILVATTVLTAIQAIVATFFAKLDETPLCTPRAKRLPPQAEEIETETIEPVAGDGIQTQETGVSVVVRSAGTLGTGSAASRRSASQASQEEQKSDPGVSRVASFDSKDPNVTRITPRNASLKKGRVQSGGSRRSLNSQRSSVRSEF